MAPTPEMPPPSPLTFSMWVVGIASRRRLMLKVMGATLLVAATVVLLRPPVYRAHASFITAARSETDIASAISATMGGAASATQSLSLALAEPMPPPEFYVQLIESVEVRRRLLHARFSDPRSAQGGDSATLLEIYQVKADDPRRAEEIALRKLGKAMSPNVNGESNLVELRVDSRWPGVSAAIANRTVSLVQAFGEEQRGSRERSRRLFLEQRVREADAALARSGEAMREFRERNRQWENSPRLVFEESQLQRAGNAATSLGIALQRQLDAARFDEADNAGAITVIDGAVPPGRAEWPHYWLLMLNALVVGGVLAVAAAGVAVFATGQRRENPGSSWLQASGSPGVADARSFPARVAFPLFAWGLAFHSLIITVLFGWFGLPENTVRTIAAWKEAGLAVLLVVIVVRAMTGRGGRAAIAWPDLWIGGLMTTAVLFLLVENLWLGFNLPAGAEFLGIRDSVYFMIAYFVGRAMPELVSDDRAMRSLFILIVLTCGIGVVERIVVTPEMLVALGVASYFQNFLGVSAFTVGNDYGLPLNYWTMIGGNLFRRAGSVYLSGQGFAVPFILFFPLATAWVFLRENRTRLLTAAYAVVVTGLVLTLTRMTILVALIQLVLFVCLIRRPEWAVAGVALAATVFVAAFVSIPGFPTFVWHTLSWQEGSSISHVTDWTKGLAVLAENPWGSGLGTADQTAVRAGLKHLTGDNLYLKYGVEMGVLGLSLLLLVLGAIGGSAMRLYRHGESLAQQRMGLALWLSVVGIAINGVTAVVFNSITLGWIFFWLAGAAVTVAQRLPMARMAARRVHVARDGLQLA